MISVATEDRTKLLRRDVTLSRDTWAVTWQKHIRPIIVGDALGRGCYKWKCSVSLRPFALSLRYWTDANCFSWKNERQLDLSTTKFCRNCTCDTV